MFDLAGKTLGKYRLVEKLGQGGMAQVYKAYQPDLDRYVAIKVLHPHLTGDPEFEARFRRESRAVALLAHPHIIRIYDFDTDQGLAFLVMEFVEGTSLRQVLRDQAGRGEPMDLVEVSGIGVALADALDYAHRQGVVHRDLKPANVLISADGRPVLTDFGVARMLDATAITDSGGTPGTPAYMSPEQGQGAPGDARSDIYALGVLLYQLCTGRVPFDADTPYAIILKHITAPLPAPRSLRPDLPEEAERIILKAMAKDPDDRFQTAGEMGQVLRQALGVPPPRPLPPQPKNWLIHAPAAPAEQALEAAPGAGRRRLSAKRIRAILAGLLIVAALAAVLGVAVWYRGWLEGVVPRITPVPTAPAVGAMGVLVLAGPGAAADTWIDPDTPEGNWSEADLVHLQGPLTPDRILVHFDVLGLPVGAQVVSATLTLRVERWGDQSLPAAAVAYRVLTPWQAGTATYNTPWTVPGLSAGWDYDSVPLGMAPLPDEGLLVLDVTPAAAAWQQGQPNNGLVVMMSADSHNQAHHWVYMTEQPDPADQPTLRIGYEVGP